MSSLFFAFLLGLSWFTADHFPPWVSWHNEIWAFAAVMWSVACLLFSKSWKSGAVIFPKLGWPMLLLAVVVIVQGITGSIQFVGDAWVLLFYLALCLGAMGVGYNIGRLPAPPVDEKVSVALETGMRTLKMDGMEKIMLGLTDLKQVRSVCIK
jgi:predicted Na+-dependent transporter